MKTNALRLLDKLGVSYETAGYEVDEEKLDAVSVAEKLGADPDSVFKTLVARGDRTGVCVFVIPGPLELNLKKAATASGNKSVELIHLRELTPLTGYIRGGCSPLAMKKQYPTWIEETARLFNAVYVSAGIRGLQILLAPDDLRSAGHAEWAELL